MIPPRHTELWRETRKAMRAWSYGLPHAAAYDWLAICHLWRTAGK